MQPAWILPHWPVGNRNICTKAGPEKETTELAQLSSAWTWTWTWIASIFVWLAGEIRLQIYVNLEHDTGTGTGSSSSCLDCQLAMSLGCLEVKVNHALLHDHQQISARVWNVQRHAKLISYIVNRISQLCTWLPISVNIKDSWCNPRRPPPHQPPYLSHLLPAALFLLLRLGLATSSSRFLARFVRNKNCHFHNCQSRWCQKCRLIGCWLAKKKPPAIRPSPVCSVVLLTAEQQQRYEDTVCFVRFNQTHFEVSSSPSPGLPPSFAL